MANATESDFEGCLFIICAVLFLATFFGLRSCSEGKLEHDGFKVIEEHSTYNLVEKDGHQYMATKEGMYGLRWQYEHYPNCPCKKDTIK